MIRRSHVHSTITAVLAVAVLVQSYALLRIYDELSELRRDIAAKERKEAELEQRSGLRALERKSKEPNQAPEPTAMSVTSPAAQEPRQP